MDILIRNLSIEVIHAIDEQADELGVSRAEFVRRELTAVAQRTKPAMTAQDLVVFGERFADLEDQGVMAGAWD